MAAPSRGVLIASLLLGAVLALSVAPEAQCATIYVGGRYRWNPWSNSVQFWRKPERVRRGDKLVFRWRRPSNVVFLHLTSGNIHWWEDFLGCRWRRDDPNAAFLVAPAADKGSATFTIPANINGQIGFFSSVKDGCQKGQKVYFNWVTGSE